MICDFRALGVVWQHPLSLLWPSVDRTRPTLPFWQVGNVMWKHHRILYAVFDCIACLDPKKDVSSISYNAYKFFVQVCVAITLSKRVSSFCRFAPLQK